MVLSFSDEEEGIYRRMLQVVSNNKNLEWCNMVQEAGNQDTRLVKRIRYLITYLTKTSVLKKKTRYGGLILHICARIMDVPDTTVP